MATMLSRERREPPGDGDDRLGGEESLRRPAQWGAPRIEMEEERDYRVGPPRAQGPAIRGGPRLSMLE